MLRRTRPAAFLRSHSLELAWRRAATAVASNSDHVVAKPFSEIPQIPSVPLLGAGWNYLPFIGKYSLSAMHKANLLKYQKYGPVVLEKFNKDVTLLLTFDIGDIEKVYRAAGRYPVRRELGVLKQYRDGRKDIYKDGGLIITNGQEWYDIRTEVQAHMMKPKTINAYLGAMDGLTKEFTDFMATRRKENGGEIPDFLNELYKWALESVGVVALDKRLGCLDLQPNPESAKLIQTVYEMFTQLWTLEFSPLPLWRYFNTPAYKSFTRNMDYFCGTIQKYLKEAQTRQKNNTEDHEATFLEQMLTTNKDPRNLISTITDMFLAGIDTTSTTVGFTLYHLAKNPEAQEKAFQEVRNIDKDKELEVSNMNNIQYIKACVKESMRLTSVVTGNIRTLDEDVVLSGYKVPAGTEIFMQSLVAGQFDKNFPEARRFRPERFLRNESTHDPFAFVPFGFGPRSCVGRRIAEQEMWTFLIRVLQRFRVEYHHEDIGLVTRLINTPDKPLRLQFFDR